MDEKLMKRLKLGFLVGFVLLLVYLIFFAGIETSMFTEEYFRELLLGFGIWGPIIFVLFYTFRSLIPIIPPLPLALAVGFIYGTFTGTILVTLGAIGSALLSFYIARFLGYDYFNKKKEGAGAIQKMKKRVEEGGWASVMTARFLNLPWDVVSYACGLCKMSLKDYLIGTAIPAPVLSFTAVFLGSSLRNVKSFSDIFTFEPMLALSIFILGIILPLMIKKHLDKKKKK